MLIRFGEGITGGYFIYFGSKDERFGQAWGSVYRTSPQRLYETMNQLRTWARKEFNEDVYFQMTEDEEVRI